VTEVTGRSIEELRRRQALIDRLLATEGAGHVVHDLPLRSDGRAVSLASRPWRLDPEPYVIAEADFALLERAITSRVEASEAILADLYGERRLVAERVVAPERLWATPHYRMSAVGSRPVRWLTSYAVDVVRDASGRWHAVQELTDAPPGLGYALMNRAALDRVDGHRDRPVPRPLAPSLVALRRGLADTTAVYGPRVVTFTGGIDHSSYIEHSYLATQLGFNLVEGADLVVRQRRLWLRTLAGLEPIDVLHRRLEDDLVDPLEVNAIGAVGVPSVLLCVQAGNLAVANAHGSGLIEEPMLAARWDDAAERLTGRRPELALPADLAGTASAGIDAVIGTRAERVPRLSEDGVVEGPVVLRMHAVATDDGIVVVPGGAGRMLADADDPRTPTPCVAKDVWVLGPPAPLVVAAPTAPQVDFISSVPTRAADSLYWLGRAAERAEALARTLRVVIPSAVDEGPTAGLLVELLASVRLDPADPDAPPADAIAAAGTELAGHVGAVLAEASSVREFLSTTTGRVLGAMVEVRATLQRKPPDTDAVDELLLQLSAFAGLWNESVVRGPAWFYGDYARRYERAVTTLSTVAFALRAAGDEGLDADHRAQALEFVLAANDSLVAYRRRHRSDVALDDVISLLVADDRNPRAVAASLVALQHDAAQIGWAPGRAGLDTVLDDLLADIGHDSVLEAIARLHALAGSLTTTRLAVPPNPFPMGSVP
jgi:uncharacterized circularly permuted ATP-grasp superfamily protein/uncharacterized alpha-E superfamily protein